MNGQTPMSSRSPDRIQKPLLTEAVMFFSEHGIAREMLFPEFEALLDGLVAAPDFADEAVEAVFLQINPRLHVRAAVFFTIDFDLDGHISRLWNLPLRHIAEQAGRGPDMGGGPIRLACLGFCNSKAYQHSLWKPRLRGGKSDLAWIKQAVTRNVLSIIGEDEEAKAVLATENLQMVAEDAWYGLMAASQTAAAPDSNSLVADMNRLRVAHAGEVTEYLRQIGELQARQRQKDQEYRRQIEVLRSEHADHLMVVQGELLDVKNELIEQQKLNSLLRRELNKLQNRTSSDTE